MKLKAILLSLCCFVSITSIFAKEINMYDEPNANAKIVSKADSSAGIIPIYSPKNTDWIKIADPRTGNVGWVKNDELNNQNVAVIQKIVVNPSPSDLKTPEINIQSSPSAFLQPAKPMSNAEMQQAIQRMQMQQMRVRQSTEQLMQATMRYLNMMFEEQAALMGVNYPNSQNEQGFAQPGNMQRPMRFKHPPGPGMMNQMHMGPGNQQMNRPMGQQPLMNGLTNNPDATSADQANELTNTQ